MDERSPEDQKAIQLMKVRGFLLSVLKGSVTMPFAGPELEKMSKLCGGYPYQSDLYLGSEFVSSQVIVELTMGCNHITCRCKTEFCFKCGGASIQGNMLPPSS